MTGWDAAASVYERQERLEEPALREALALLAPQRDERLLDVATGTGALLRALAVRPGPPLHAVGVDSSAAMLARVGPLPAGWELVRGDARALPFAPASFDLVSAAYLLHTLDRDARAAVLAEIARVLRPGGRVVTVTVATPRPRLRALLARTPRALGLHPLDPRPELAGLVVRAARWVPRGYPSLCVLAERP